MTVKKKKTIRYHSQVLYTMKYAFVWFMIVFHECSSDCLSKIGAAVGHSGIRAWYPVSAGLRCAHHVCYISRDINEWETLYFTNLNFLKFQSSPFCLWTDCRVKRVFFQFYPTVFCGLACRRCLLKWMWLCLGVCVGMRGRELWAFERVCVVGGCAISFLAHSRSACNAFWTLTPLPSHSYWIRRNYPRLLTSQSPHRFASSDRARFSFIIHIGNIYLYIYIRDILPETFLTFKTTIFQQSWFLAIIFIFSQSTSLSVYHYILHYGRCSLTMNVPRCHRSWNNLLNHSLRLPFSPRAIERSHRRRCLRGQKQRGGEMCQVVAGATLSRNQMRSMLYSFTAVLSLGITGAISENCTASFSLVSNCAQARVVTSLFASALTSLLALALAITTLVDRLIPVIETVAVAFTFVANTTAVAILLSPRTLNGTFDQYAYLAWGSELSIIAAAYHLLASCRSPTRDRLSNVLVEPHNTTTTNRQ